MNLCFKTIKVLTDLKYFIGKLFQPTVVKFNGLSHHIHGNTCYIGNILFTYNYYYPDGLQWKSLNNTITITKILIKDLNFIREDRIKCWKVTSTHLGIQETFTEQEVLKILLERAVSIYLT